MRLKAFPVWIADQGPLRLTFLTAVTMPTANSISSSGSRNLSAQILLVEDDATVRDSLCGALESVGLAVCPTPGGRAAVQCFATAPFDLVIIDAGLGDRPDNSQWHALRGIRPGQPHLVLTVHGLRATTAVFSEALAVLEKPVSVAELCALLQRHLTAAGPVPQTNNGAF